MDGKQAATVLVSHVYSNHSHNTYIGGKLLRVSETLFSEFKECAHNRFGYPLLEILMRNFIRIL